MVSLASRLDLAKRLDIGLLGAGVAAWAVAGLIAFRSFVFSSTDFVFGDRGDGRLIVYLHEHLFNAVRGRADWLSPPIFYPQKNVLGFTDAFLLDMPGYSALRGLGLDPFLSFQLWAMALSFCCFMASLIIATRHLRLRPGFAIAAAALVTFPNNLMFKTGAGHINFFAVYYIPCIALLALSGVKDFLRPTPWSQLRLGIAAALFGLLFSTAFYVAWMFALTALIAAAVAAIIFRHDLIAAWRKYATVRVPLAAGMSGFVAGIVPFLLVYLPALSIVPGRSLRD